MNDLTASIYLLCFVGIAGATFAFMWKMTTASLEALNQPIKRKVPAPHPEMEGVKYGEELLVFKQEEDEKELD